MSAPPGIEQFDAIAMLAFAKLFDAFPNPLDLDGGDIGAAYCATWGDQAADGEMFATISSTGESTLEWLAEEGFIRYEPGRRALGSGPSHPNARLTLRGLSALRAVPSSVGEPPHAAKSFGEQALDAAGKGTKLAIGEFSCQRESNNPHL